MKEEEYLHERLDQQIVWYSKQTKSEKQKDVHGFEAD